MLYDFLKSAGYSNPHRHYVGVHEFSHYEYHITLTLCSHHIYFHNLLIYRRVSCLPTSFGTRQPFGCNRGLTTRQMMPLSNGSKFTVFAKLVAN